MKWSTVEGKGSIVAGKGAQSQEREHGRREGSTVAGKGSTVEGKGSTVAGRGDSRREQEHNRREGSSHKEGEHSCREGEYCRRAVTPTNLTRSETRGTNVLVRPEFSTPCHTR